MAAPKQAVGPKSDKLWRNAIMRAVNRAEKGDPTKFLERLADKAVELGLAGDVQALKEIGDRLDGRAVQGMTLDSDNLGLKVVIEGGLPQALETPTDDSLANS